MIKTTTITLPSTVQLDIRQLSLAEENEMAQAKRATVKKQERLINRIMSACVREVVDPGPYAFLTAGEPFPLEAWRRVISADRVSMMIELHKISYKDGHLLNVDRIKCRRCNVVYAWSIVIDEDMTYRPLPAESVDHLREERPFAYTLEDHTVHFVLGTGETEEQFDKLCKQHKGARDITAGLRSRIVDVTTPAGEKLDRAVISSWLDGWGGKFPGITSEQAEDLRDVMDRVDGGWDLEVEAHCDDCGEMAAIMLPFDAIFAPGTHIKDRRRERRGRAYSGG